MGLKTISSIISGSVITLIGLYVWHKQNDTSQNQKLYETKLETLKKFTIDGGKMMFFSEFLIRTKLELFQMMDKESDSLISQNSLRNAYDRTLENQVKIHIEPFFRCSNKFLTIQR